ncbi:MAG: chalcone isomerase family protein [Bdellovibrionales bacterium]|nr:chalcone isomerase family protein [Bdellovibrionales bacterium]
MKRTIFCLLHAALICLVVPSTVFGASLAGVTLPDEADVGGKSLVLNGLGLREATFFKVDVYVAGLYLEQKSNNAREIVASQGTKLLDMKFVRDVDKEKLTEAWIEGFQKNSVKYGRLKDRVAQLNSMMSDVEDGSTMRFIFNTETVEVFIAGEKKGSIEGRDFVEGMLSVWLGKHPPNEELKEGLLGK